MYIYLMLAPSGLVALELAVNAAFIGSRRIGEIRLVVIARVGFVRIGAVRENWEIKNNS